MEGLVETGSTFAQILSPSGLTFLVDEQGEAEKLCYRNRFP